MSDFAIKALMLPFEKGLLDAPGPGRGFFIRADTDPALLGPWQTGLVCEQTFKPAFDRLVVAGFTVVSRLEGRFETGLCLLTKHKRENLVNIARAWTLLGPGGVLVCAGVKTVGAASIEHQVAGEIGQSGSIAKYHCRVFWTVKPVSAPPSSPAAWGQWDDLRPNIDGIYLTRPGIFGWDGVDAGSRLLIESLPDDISGRVADLGSGWGYLSVNVLARYSNVEQIDLYEAEHLALDAARANLTEAGFLKRARFHWHDVVAGAAEGGGYDYVVMNPPFHSGRATDTSLGCAFIAAAAAALRRGGWLLMVANRQLPYEAALQQHFSVVQNRVETKQFKVVFARR